MISTGLDFLDSFSGGLRQGDNVVWEVSEEIPLNYFISAFFKKNRTFKKNIIYINFNFSPQTITRRYSELFENHKVILIDAFTNGKGNRDPLFHDFYQGLTEDEKKQFICVENPGKSGDFMSILNSVEQKNRDGSFYIFDSLTGMNELWKDESAVLDFFAFTCPKLYDLNTLAYWSFINNAHSKEFTAGLTHITQVVFSIKASDNENFELFVKKMQFRESRQNRKAVKFRISEGSIDFDQPHDDTAKIIGDNVRMPRNDMNLTQTALAKDLGMTAGALSQIEHGQTSPSLHTLILMSEKFGKDIEFFIGKDRPSPAHTYRTEQKKILSQNKNFTIYRLSDRWDENGMAPCIITGEAGKSIKGPLLFHKGREFICPLKGAITLTLENTTIRLEEGESVCIDKSFIKKIKNESSAQSEILYIIF